ncbi:hypothetical protein PO002_08495 [Cupriavidus necator]|uniref:hypothetical protein n=1 Tax=Cupriavidus necator TaxID=106590 RepID=UPI0039C13317
MARVALSHGLNPNMVHRWMREDRQRQMLTALSEGHAFVPLQVDALSAITGLWRMVRRVPPQPGSFSWPAIQAGATGAQLTQAQFDALVLGLPWQRLEDLRAITRI